jgi:hypothetical protein
MIEYNGDCLWNGMYLVGYQASKPRKPNNKLDIRASVTTTDTGNCKMKRYKTPCAAEIISHTKE